MAGCDGWITLKIFELIFCVFCIIFKRVTDDEANKLFYFLQKISREWPLLNNITWEENGAIFTDVTYGGFVIITAGLILAQCTGELNRAKRLENFFLSLGALMFIAAGSLELAALDSVEERLVDNAAILGVISLMAGLLFLVDLILASKRRKKEALRSMRKPGADKTTQTEDTKLMEVYRASADMNGNVHGQQQSNGYHQPQFLKMDSKKIPTNGVKILPTSPVLDENFRIPVTNSHNEFVGTIPSPQVFSASELKAPQAKIRSTESFLRSEKGEMPQVRRRATDSPPPQVMVPPGYVLVPASSVPRSEDSTPVGYAQINPADKTPKARTAVEYVMVPMENLETPKTKEGGRNLQSPTVTTTVRTPPGYRGYHDPEDRQTPYPHPSYGHSNLSLSDADDPMPKKSAKYSPEYLQMNMQARKYSPLSDDSSELPRYFPAEHFPQYKAQDSRRPQEKWTYLPPPAGNANRGYDDNDEVDFVTPFKRNSSTRSSRVGQQEKPKSILRVDQFRGSTKKDKHHAETDLSFPKEVNYNSLDSQKIADDLKQLKEITKSDLDLSRDLEKENQILKAHLRKEKEEKEKLKQNFQIELQHKEDEARHIIQKTVDDVEDRKKLEARITDLEDLKRQMKLDLRDVDERNKLEQKIRDLEDEKDRRMSERDEQYFGIVDLRHSHKNSSPVSHPKLSVLPYEGAKDINVQLKEKVLEMEDMGKDDDEPRKVIDDGFHFLHESEKKKGWSIKKPEISSKPKLVEKRSAPDLTNMYQKSIEAFKAKSHSGKSSGSRGNLSETPSPGQRSEDSDETPYSQITDRTSYKSEAQFWLSGDKSTPGSTPASPRDPGYVLHTAHNWPESTSPTPQDRFLFSSQKAQQVSTEGEPTKILEFVDFEEPKKSSHTSQLLDNDELAEPTEKVEGRRRGLLIRKVDFAEEPDTIFRPASVTGSTSTWKKWLQPKAKLHPTRSTPN